MTAIPGIRVDWTPRGVPLPPRAVAAVGTAARALAHRLLVLDDAALGVLTAVAGADLIVVLGDAAALPWVDGVVYLGRDDTAADLLLPTALTPTVPPRALAAAIGRVARPGPVAVLAAPARLVPCGAARAIDRTRLVAWSETR